MRTESSTFALFERMAELLQILGLELVLGDKRLELTLVDRSTVCGFVEQRLHGGKLKQFVQDVPFVAGVAGLRRLLPQETTTRPRNSSNVVPCRDIPVLQSVRRRCSGEVS